jgi:hypothetical protein
MSKKSRRLSRFDVPDWVATVSVGILWLATIDVLIWAVKKL